MCEVDELGVPYLLAVVVAVLLSKYMYNAAQIVWHESSEY